MKNIVCIIFALFFVFTDCSSGNRDGDRPLIADPVEESEKPNDPKNPDGNGNSEQPVVLNGIFLNNLGSVISSSSVSKMPADETGKRVSDDYDGDGIANEDEITTNPFVAEYPKVLTRISTPIPMEIRICSTSDSEIHVETIEEDLLNQHLLKKPYLKMSIMRIILIEAA